MEKGNRQGEYIQVREMRDAEIQNELKRLGQRFRHDKRYTALQLVGGLESAMEPIGGITGFKVKSEKTITIYNHSDSYKLPIQVEEHRKGGLTSFGRRVYQFVEALEDRLHEQGADRRKIEYHLGRDYSTKDHLVRRAA